MTLLGTNMHRKEILFALVAIMVGNERFSSVVYYSVFYQSKSLGLGL